MFGVSKLAELPQAVELFLAGGARLIAYVLLAIPVSQLGKLVPRARQLLKHREVEA
jgi:hypothetical protein